MKSGRGLVKAKMNGDQVNLTELRARALWTSDSKLHNGKRLRIGLATMNTVNVRNNTAKAVVEQFHKAVFEPK